MTPRSRARWDTIVDNGSATITITATVKAGASTLTNNASVSSTTPDPDNSDNSASAAINVITSADLAIAKTGATTNPDQGATTSYMLTVSNNGPNAASGVVVNDSLPSQFTATAAGGGGFGCTLPGGPGGTVVCTLASLAPTNGAPVQITITGTVAAGTAGQAISDAATVTSNTGDPDQTNNTATFNQVVGPIADVAISKQALESDGKTPVTTPLAVGGTFIYALTATNNGPDAANAVTVTDPLPSGLSFSLGDRESGQLRRLGSDDHVHAGHASGGNHDFDQPRCHCGHGRLEHRPNEHRDGVEHDGGSRSHGQFGERDGRRGAGRQPLDRQDGGPADGQPR